MKPIPPIDGGAVKHHAVDLSTLPEVRILGANDFSDEVKQDAARWMSEAIDAEVRKTLRQLAMTGRAAK